MNTRGQQHTALDRLVPAPRACWRSGRRWAEAWPAPEQRESAGADDTVSVIDRDRMGDRNVRHARISLTFASSDGSSMTSVIEARPRATRPRVRDASARSRMRSCRCEGQRSAAHSVDRTMDADLDRGPVLARAYSISSDLEVRSSVSTHSGRCPTPTYARPMDARPMDAREVAIEKSQYGASHSRCDLIAPVGWRPVRHARTEIET